MTSQAISKNISNTLPKELEHQVDDDFTLIKDGKNIKKINLEDFPTPGSVILTKEQERDIVSSNKISCARKIELEEPIVTDPRTIAFNHMSNKDKMAKALSCTKACRNIQKDPETGKFGVCVRKYCTFAHSMDELQPARCSFDLVCRFRNGRIIDWNTRTIAPGSKCKFRHSDETVDQYYARSGMTRPDLPPTSEHTRKIPEQPKEQPKEEPKEQPKKQPKKQPKEQKVSRRAYDSDMSSESSDSESSESEEEKRRRLKKERKARKSPKNDIQVIRVPTKELAEIALKMAFDRGQFNVQVLIE
tara:strand:- start:4463 stop:5371 length:909 start_codon:yes stop_codon:yes gene_type:complete